MVSRTFTPELGFDKKFMIKERKHSPRSIEGGLNMISKIDHAFDQAVQRRIDRHKGDENLADFGETELASLTEEQKAAGGAVLGFDPSLLIDVQANADKITEQFVESMGRRSDGIDEHFGIDADTPEDAPERQLADMARNPNPNHKDSTKFAELHDAWMLENRK